MIEGTAPLIPPITNGSILPKDTIGQTVTAVAAPDSISADEIALYDRQIRLWGVQAQEKIRTANILLINIKALANEIAKNLVLAGVGSITLADHQVVTEEDLGAQFLISEDDVGKNRAEAAAPQVQKLNPRVKVNVLTTNICNAPNENFYAQFDVIIATDLPFASLFALNAGARIGNRPFYAGASHGLYGYIFADLIAHTFVIEREKSNRATSKGAETPTRTVVDIQTKRENGKAIEMVTKQEIYTPLMLAKDSPLSPDITANARRLKKVHPLLTAVRALWEYQRSGLGIDPTHSQADLSAFTKLATEKHKELLLPSDTLTADFLRSFLQNLGSEVAPVTAFLGGQLAQDVINVLGHREQPVQNLMLFDGEESLAPVYTLHSGVQGVVLPILPASGAGAAVVEID
ncbi:hypothetical protein P153DRAFT_341817 [Dothidotthia symphoricarpi CBS 119687]|uniref:Ubiquitin-like 1-activating enzyme E1A n=1 Tax=Dothidotthia symphoricarpi CBS 119687 TaxID=1392245 RepID=A0A6A6AAP5_9PLEO|nr:uncharacterized protein P153DRAFT_341817 [Dothidotthia symphoricarpi CBS 119687]KAF2128293.1 hypothetical protein P153DRAFT_341817 [Dothidotthia symphoricarpi CBS 119687]